MNMRPVFQIPIQSLVETKFFDLATYHIPPKRFRFIDCAAFIDDNLLRVVECENIQNVPYSAISYVWRGNQLLDHDPPLGLFSVVVPQDEISGDPISIDVLRAACMAALQISSYIWLDQLCILQSDGDDKAWQIRNMRDI